MLKNVKKRPINEYLILKSIKNLIPAEFSYNKNIPDV